MKQIPKLNYASGSVTALTERKKSHTAVQVCLLVITVLMLLPSPSVTAAFKKKLRNEPGFITKTTHHIQGIISLGSQRHFYLFHLASDLSWMTISRGMLQNPILLLETMQKGLKKKPPQNQQGDSLQICVQLQVKAPPLVITYCSVIPKIFLPSIWSADSEESSI